MELMENQLKTLYDRYTEEQISSKISELVTPDGIKPEIKVIYQNLENLHLACPGHQGDWYFQELSNSRRSWGGKSLVYKFCQKYEYKSLLKNMG